MVTFWIKLVSRWLPQQTDLTVRDPVSFTTIVLFAVVLIPNTYFELYCATTLALTAAVNPVFC